MNRNQIGNEVNYLGTTEMEVDYRAHTWRCCWKRTLKEAGIGAAIFVGLSAAWFAYWAVALA